MQNPQRWKRFKVPKDGIINPKAYIFSHISSNKNISKMKSVPFESMPGNLPDIQQKKTLPDMPDNMRIWADWSNNIK